MIIITTIEESVRTAYGPKGMNKILTIGPDFMVTNDGETFMQKINVRHPSANVLVEMAKSQKVVAGDGVKTAIILTSELLKLAFKLIDQKIHPATIIRGFSLAAKKACEILEQNATQFHIANWKILRKLAKTAVTGKVPPLLDDYLADLIVAGAKKIATAEEKYSIFSADVENVGIIAKEGGGAKDSELIDGLIIQKSHPHPRMPVRVNKAKIALLNCALEMDTKATGWRKELIISEPKQLKALRENSIVRELVSQIKELGIDAVFCRKRISESVQRCFAAENVLSIELVGEKDMERLSKATGAKVTSNVNDLRPSDLGEADLIEFRKVGGEEMLFVEGFGDRGVATLCIRGCVKQFVDEVERVAKDALKVVLTTLRERKIIAGGGAFEVEAFHRLKSFSKLHGGREQLAIDAYAEAMKAIPTALAINSGLDSIDIFTQLIALHASQFKNAGINAYKGVVKDTLKDGIIDSVCVKRHAIKLASETAVMLLRIDDMIVSGRPEKFRREKEREFRELQRIRQDELRRFFEKEEELQTIDREVKQRALSTLEES
jgi:chaperonin GroEL (HSP60 family)